MTQGQRDGVMIAFKDGRERLLVATDVAARGLDIRGVSHIVNYDIPNSPDIYVHRIGRTGRAGESGRAITMITAKQRGDLKAIERHAKTEIPAWSPNGSARTALADDRAESRAARESSRRPQERSPRDGSASGEPASEERPSEERPEPRRPRHTKPRRGGGGTTKLIVGAGRAQGVEPADLVAAIVDHSHLDGEDVRNVRVLERFSFVEVPAARASEVVEKVNGNEVRGQPLRLEVAKR